MLCKLQPQPRQFIPDIRPIVRTVFSEIKTEPDALQGSVLTLPTGPRPLLCCLGRTCLPGREGGLSLRLKAAPPPGGTALVSASGPRSISAPRGQRLGTLRFYFSLLQRKRNGVQLRYNQLSYFIFHDLFCYLISFSTIICRRTLQEVLRTAGPVCGGRCPSRQSKDQP